LEQVIALLSVAERRLVKLYWGSKLSVDEIYDAFSVDRFKQYLTDLKIDQPKDIYKKINQLAGKCFTTAKQKFPNEVVDYNINKKTMKFLLRQFLHNFQIEV
ncbi:MAG: hypothetical protein H8D45_04785, partial [Bacteroidetes bacterium]|nr:hypothetical protein [Bacteroidota bacterium]